MSLKGVLPRWEPLRGKCCQKKFTDERMHSHIGPWKGGKNLKRGDLCHPPGTCFSQRENRGKEDIKRKTPRQKGGVLGGEKYTSIKGDTKKYVLRRDIEN